jgi:ELWxxDGT repeat protein
MWDFDYTFITVFGNRAYFTATDEEHGNELWTTDGTDAGTALFTDLVPGLASSYPSGLAVSGGKLYFTALDTASLGPRLWVTDGTAGGVRAIAEVSASSSLWPVGGRIYFPGTTPLTGAEPWVTDGTDAGTHIIANIAPDKAPSSRPGGFRAAGNRLVFWAIEGLTAPSGNMEPSLWSTDGTAGGTFKLIEGGQHAETVMSAGPLVFFRTDTNRKLMMTDGTLEGTKSADFFLRRFGGFRVDALFPFGDAIYARVNDTGTDDYSLWKTTAGPDAAGTRLGAINPYPPIDVAGHLVFFARTATGVHQRALWTSDGTPSGTYAIVPDLNADYQGISNVVNAAGTLFFLKTVRDEKTKLWKSEGTLDGTVVVKELPAASAYGSELKAAGRKVFFGVGGAVWVSDGTEAGTQELMKIAYYSFPRVENLTPVGKRMLFTSADGKGGLDLWASDGTREGTKLLKSEIGSPVFTNIDETVYFAASDDAHGTEMWTTDGTPEGTKLFLDVEPGPESSYPYGFTKIGNLLYFSAYTSATGTELWALPLTESRVSIADSRVNEGDAGSSALLFAVSLSPAAKQAVTVEYATSDGTARAGQDYEAASGTLTFPPGETTKTIEVRVRGNLSPENNKTLFVNLRNATGANLAKGEAFGIIDDDDQIADVGIQAVVVEDLYDGVTVSNQGPRGATDIALRVTSTPFHREAWRCYDCLIPQLVAGESKRAALDTTTPIQQIYFSATETARQRDPQLSNNSASWTVSAYRSMAMSAAYLTPGATATITAKSYSQTPNTVAVTSSDPSVVSAPATATKVREGVVTFAVTALKPGTSTMKVEGNLYPLLVTVVASGAKPRFPGGVTVDRDYSIPSRFDNLIAFKITPTGTALFSGAQATGTIVVSTSGQQVARQSINGAPVSVQPYPTSLGLTRYEVAYSGDENFLPQTTTMDVFVSAGMVTLTGALQRVGNSGALALTVHAIGSPVRPPTGTIAVTSGGTLLTSVPLVPASGESIATATLNNLAASTTVTVEYPGDAFHGRTSQQIRVIEPRRRSASH